MWQNLDVYCSIPIGVYEGYAMLSFFEILVIYVGGTHKATLALTAQGIRDSHSCRCYTPCELCCPSQNLSNPPVSMKCCTFSNGRALYDFLKFSVAQYMVTKPLITILMYVLDNALQGTTLSEYIYLLRIVNVATLMWCAQAALQMYNAVLPRLRGLGGDKVFNMLTLVMAIIMIQEFVTSFLVLEAFLTTEDISGFKSSDFTGDATDLTSVRCLALFTIVEFTIFLHIFYRCFTPELFEGGPSFMWSQQHDKSMSTVKFLIAVFSVWNIFDEHETLKWDPTLDLDSSDSAALRARLEATSRGFGGDDDDEDFVMETTPLISQPNGIY